MDYSEVLRRSFDLLKRTRAILVLGILMALFGGGGAPSFNYSFGSGDFVGLPQPFLAPSLPHIRPEVLFLLILLFVAFVLVLAIVAVVVRYISMAGLIDGVARTEEGEAVTVLGALRRGASARALYLFLADIALFIPVALVALVALAVVASPLVMGVLGAVRGERPIVIVGGIVGFLVLLLPFIAIITLAGILVALILQWAHRAIVLGDEGPLAGLATGWRTLRAHLVESAILWGIQLALTLIAGIAAAVVTLVLLALTGGVLFVLWRLAESVFLVVLFGIPAAIVIWVISAIVQGIVVAYVETYWTLAWLELQ